MAVAAPADSCLSGAPAISRSYLICSTPRTGSYLLCDALTATGVAGRPTEYLMPSYRTYWTAQWGTRTYRDFHDRVLADGTTENGVFGTKIHAGQLVEFIRQATGRPRLAMEDRPAVVEEWFPHPRYVWLRRRNPVEQAVSWAKACQTRLWWDADAPPAPMDAPKPEALRFDYQFIERAMYSLNDWDGVWRTYFDSTGITPVTVWYEDLVADKRGTIERVLDHLGVGGTATEAPVEAKFRRQSDGTSAAWALRFDKLSLAKRESTLAALAGLHKDETIFVCVSGQPLDSLPHDAVTISVDGAASPVPASYSLLTRTPITDPAAGVVLATGAVTVNHPFIVRFLVDRGPPGGAPRRNRLIVGNRARATDIAVGLAEHLGARQIEMA